MVGDAGSTLRAGLIPGRICVAADEARLRQNRVVDASGKTQHGVARLHRRTASPGHRRTCPPVVRETPERVR